MQLHVTGNRRRRFQQLQWKLMRSYVVVTVSAVLSIYLLLWMIFGYTASRPALSPQELATSARAIAVQVSRPASASSPDTAVLVQTLRPLLRDRMSAAVTSPSGKVLACVPEGFPLVGTSLFAQTPPEVKALARAALENKGGNVSLARLSARDADGNSMAVAPVLGANRQVVGLLFVRMLAPVDLRDFSRQVIASLLMTAVFAGFFAAVVGLGFGFLNARQLTRRLKAIADAADAWSRGEFSAVATDNSQDELGQLARRLNQMATELRGLVVLRQNLATAEERNRLSRELHDTVKQQVFATTMQVGAARMLLDRDINQARARLMEGERLALEAQQELTAILEQLRPGTYAPNPKTEENLESTLRTYIELWTRQSGISTDVRVGALPVLPAQTQQALLRITQEALANVARHSGAVQVRVKLEMASWNGASNERGEGRKRATGETASGQRLKLVIQDNGGGFDPLHINGGFGLRSMRERAEDLPRGTFLVESLVGHGTCVEMTCITA